MKNKIKAQASIEFLSTYGWIMIILLLALGIIANYGLLSPSKYLPDKADFGEQLKAEEYYLDYDSRGNGSNEPVLSIKFRNNFARAINITNMRIKRDGYSSYSNCAVNWSDVGVGEEVIFACGNLTLSQNIKNEIFVEMDFKRNSSNTNPEHTISGIIFTEPNEGNYCNLLVGADLIKDIDNNYLVCS